MYTKFWVENNIGQSLCIVGLLLIYVILSVINATAMSILTPSKVLYQCVSVYICNILPAISYFFVNLLLLFCFNCNGRYGHRVLPVLVAEFTSQVFINVAPFTCSYMAARFCCKMFLCSMLALYLCKCSSNFIFAQWSKNHIINNCSSQNATSIKSIFLHIIYL